MADWSEINGNFSELTKPTMETHFGRWMYFYILKRKDDLVSASGLDENPLIRYESLHQAMNPKKKDEAKYTWHGIEMVPKLDANGDKIKEKNKLVREEQEGDWPIKKYLTVNGDVKGMLVFLLTRFIFEVQQAYEDNGNSFDEGENVLSQVAEYSYEHCDPHLASAIIAATDPKLVDVEKLLPDNGFNSDRFKCDSLHKYILDRTLSYFKDKQDSAPHAQVSIIVTQFIKFLKLISFMIAEACWVKKQPVGAPLFLATIRNIFVFIRSEGEEFSGELASWMNEWIDTCKKLKKQKREERIAKKDAVEETEDHNDNAPVDDEVEEDLDAALDAVGEDDNLDDADDFDDDAESSDD